MSEAGMLSGPPIALSMGDPSGIGPEIALMAWLQREPNDKPFFVLGDPDHLQRVAQRIGLSVPIAACQPEDAAAAFASALPVFRLSHKVRGEPAKPDAADAKPTIEAIESGVRLVCEGRAHALVTNPISKDNLYKAGFNHPGHTEFLGELAERYFGAKTTPVMMLWSPELAVVPTTIHVSVRQAIEDLNEELIVETGRIVAHDLRERFGVAAPRLAVSGLNPHAGENGAMGREDIDIIAPAVAQLRAEGVNARGPLPGDTLFHKAARETYDAAICMYHDQALIPIKTIAFDSAVNVTLGLPFIRTSPDHGTAYDIAGTGKASAASLRAALRLAARLASADADARA